MPCDRHLSQRPVHGDLRRAGNEEAASWYQLSGDLARAVFANSEAAASYENAIALGHPEVGRLHLSLGELALARGDYQTATRELRAAASQVSGPDLARVEHRMGDLNRLLGRFDLAEESFEQGLLEYPHYTRPQLWRDSGGRERAPVGEGAGRARALRAGAAGDQCALRRGCRRPARAAAPEPAAQRDRGHARQPLGERPGGGYVLHVVAAARRRRAADDRRFVELNERAASVGELGLFDDAPRSVAAVGPRRIAAMRAESSACGAASLAVSSSAPRRTTRRFILLWRRPVHLDAHALLLHRISIAQSHGVL